MRIELSAMARAIEPSLIRTLRDAAGPDSLDLGLGQTDLPVDERVVEAIIAHVEARRAPYAPNLGLAGMRGAVAERYAISPEEVLITCGVQQGLALALMGLVQRGDEVLVPDPGFVAYPNLVRSVGAKPVPYPLRAPRFDLELELIEELVTTRTRAIVINSPGNPTGAVHDPETMRRVLKRLAELGVLWISDEIYEDYVYDGQRHVSPAEDAELAECGVRLSGLSKSHHMMGWRLGWVTAPRRIIEGLKGLHQHHVTCAPTLVQRGGVMALAHHEAITSHARAVFASRREAIMAHVDALPGVSAERPAGAFYVWLDVHKLLKPGYDSLTLAKALLEQEDVITVPGIGFGAAGAGHLRLAYTIDQTQCDEAMKRVARFVARRLTERA